MFMHKEVFKQSKEGEIELYQKIKTVNMIGPRDSNLRPKTYGTPCKNLVRESGLGQ